MNRNKILFIISIIIFIAVVFGFQIYRNQPKQIISDVNSVGSLRVSYNGSVVNVDEKKIVNILSKYSSKRTSQNYFPYQVDRIAIEIDFIENHEPKHILLGEFYIWYSDNKTYDILDGQKLMEEVERIIE